MKQLITLSFLFLSIIGKSQQYSSLKKERLNGKIKSVECFRYYVSNKNGEIQKGRRGNGTKKIFNELGLIQKLLEYSFGSINSPSETFYYYDTLGRITKRTTPSEYSQGGVYYNYNQGEIITTRNENSWGTNDRTILNAAGYDSIIINTVENQTGLDVTRSEYDSQENITKEINIIYEIDGVTQKEIKWTQLYTNKYDKNNNLIETFIFRKDNSGARHVTIYFDGINFGTMNSTLNCSITYNKFDKNMNWIKMTKYIDGVASYIIERIITYY